MAPIQETTAPGARGWAAVAALALATFTVVTSEMLPVGLLTPIGGALSVSEGTAGLTLTVTGLTAAVSAPLLTPRLGRFDRRAVLVGLMVLLAGGNALAAWSPSYAVMLAARVLVGAGMGGVWAVAAGLAPRLVAPRAVGLATSLIFSGVAFASVLGVPAGTFAGDLLGWRAAFAAAAVLAVAVAVALAALVPPLPPGDAPAGGTLGVLRQPRIATGLAVVALLVTGHFAAYTYVRPVLEDVAGADPAQIGTLLLAYGLAGVAGTFVAGAAAPRWPRRMLVAIAGVLAAAVAAVPLRGGTPVTAAVVLVVWGVAYGGVSVTTQTWLQASAPAARETVSALFAGVFNGAIAMGAFAGGLVADGLAVTATMWLCCVLAATAAVVAASGRAPAGTLERFAQGTGVTDEPHGGAMVRSPRPTRVGP